MSCSTDELTEAQEHPSIEIHGIERDVVVSGPFQPAPNLN